MASLRSSKSSPLSIRRSITVPDLVLILAVVAFWGFAFVPIKIALGEIPPFALAALRFFFAAVPAMLFIRRPSMPWRDIAAYGVAIGVFQYGLLFLGIKLGMPVGLSSLVIQVQVFFTIGLAVMFGSDRLSRANLVGGAIAAIGIGELAVYKLAAGMTGTLAGFVLILIAGFAWAVGNIIGKRAAVNHRADMFGLVVWSSIIPALPLALLSFAFEGGSAVATSVAHASWQAWVCVFLLSWGATLFGFGSWASLLQRYSVGLIMPFGLLIPVSGLIFGALLLDERLVLTQMVGVVLVMLGLAVNVFGERCFARLRVGGR
ncbi:MAG: EamA family transporter [Casimicrobiaceae bacterium]